MALEKKRERNQAIAYIVRPANARTQQIHASDYFVFFCAAASNELNSNKTKERKDKGDKHDSDG